MRSRRLPQAVEINGKTYPINHNGDYEIALDIMEVLKDKDLSESEKAYTALCIFYNFNYPQDADGLKKALDEVVNFIDCGATENKEKPQSQRPLLMDWNKDFDMIADAIIPIIGYDVREAGKYTHWWTFVGAYNQIGEGPFNTIVSIRTKKQKHKKLDKWEEEFYIENREKIDLDVNFSAEEEQFFKEILGDKY